MPLKQGGYWQQIDYNTVSASNSNAKSIKDLDVIVWNSRKWHLNRIAGFWTMESDLQDAGGRHHTRCEIKNPNKSSNYDNNCARSFRTPTAFTYKVSGGRK